MGGGDHAHVGLDRLVAADAVVVAVGQHAQQARLQLRGHVADLVEEQRATLGLLEAAAPHRLRAGESAALVAEQLAFQQVARDRRGVQRDERPALARAVLVQRTRDDFLAAARFARDEHRDVGLAQPSDGAEHLLHGWRLAEDLRHFQRRVVHARLAQALIHRAADQLDRLVHVERLGQVLEGPTLERRHGTLQIRERGHDDHRQRRVLALDLAQQLDAVEARHADVRHQHLRAVELQLGHHLLRAAEQLARDAFAAERLLQHPANRTVVIDDPDRLHGATTGMGATGRGRRPGGRRGECSLIGEAEES